MHVFLKEFSIDKKNSTPPERPTSTDPGSVGTITLKVEKISLEAPIYLIKKIMLEKIVSLRVNDRVILRERGDEYELYAYGLLKGLVSSMDAIPFDEYEDTEYETVTIYLKDGYIESNWV